jgi:hypothetical protein
MSVSTVISIEQWDLWFGEKQILRNMESKFKVQSSKFKQKNQDANNRTHALAWDVDSFGVGLNFELWVLNFLVNRFGKVGL